MAKVKSFLDEKTEKEFDQIMQVFALMIVSSVVICGGIYAAAYTQTSNGLFESVIIIAVGFAFYLLINWTGLDALKGFLEWNGIIKKQNLNEDQRLKRSINVHLSLALYLSTATAIIVAILYGSSKIFLTGFDTSAFQNIAMAVIIAESIFAGLMAAQLHRYKKRVLTIYQILIFGILFSLVDLITIGLGVGHVMIMFTTTLSIFCMYFLFSLFNYYTKVLLKEDINSVNLKPHSPTLKVDGGTGNRTQAHTV